MTIFMLLDDIGDAVLNTEFADGKGGWDTASTDGKAGWDTFNSGKAGW